jgi:hypothetical protein
MLNPKSFSFEAAFIKPQQQQQQQQQQRPPTSTVTNTTSTKSTTTKPSTTQQQQQLIPPPYPKAPKSALDKTIQVCVNVWTDGKLSNGQRWEKIISTAVKTEVESAIKPFQSTGKNNINEFDYVAKAMNKFDQFIHNELPSIVETGNSRRVINQHFNVDNAINESFRDTENQLQIMINKYENENMEWEKIVRDITSGQLENFEPIQALTSSGLQHEPLEKEEFLLQHQQFLKSDNDVLNRLDGVNDSVLKITTDLNKNTRIISEDMNRINMETQSLVRLVKKRVHQPAPAQQQPENKSIITDRSINKVIRMDSNSNDSGSSRVV